MLRKGLLCGAMLLLCSRAEAALTESEKLQVATFVSKGAVDSAPRVRALVARPDLTPEEAAEPLKRGFSGVPFDDARRRFADALLFGPGSAASRSTLVPPLVDGLLARAAVRMVDVPAEPKGPLTKSERTAAAEVLAIHAFLDQRIANFGNPPADGHDTASAIHDDAWRAAAESERAHRAAHGRWFTNGGTGGPLPPEIVHLRAQTALTLIDFSRGIVARRELSSWLGFAGIRKDTFERYGVLVETTAPDDRVAEAMKLFEATPAALDGLSLLLMSKASPAGVAARGAVVSTGVDMGATRRPADGDKLWPAEVKPSAPEVALSLAAETAALRSVERTFQNRADIAARSRAASTRAAASGAAGYLAKAVLGIALEQGEKAGRAPSSPEIVLAGAVRLLLLDGERALHLALIRSAEGHPEPLEQFATALAVLAGGGNRAALGRTRADGSIEADAATDVKVEDGVATGFVLGGKHVTVLAAKGGAFQATVDGAAPKMTSLSSYRERMEEGRAFRAGNIDFTTLFGSPRAASLDDGRLAVEGSKGGFDALVTSDAIEDGEVTARIVPKGPGGGLLLRASPGEVSYVAVALLLSTEPSKSARLLAFGSKGKAVELAAPLPLPEPPKDGYAVSLEASGSAVTARIDGKTISGMLSRELPLGNVGLAVLAGGRVDVHDFKARPCPPPAVPSKTNAPKPSGSCFKALAKGGR